MTVQDSDPLADLPWPKPAPPSELVSAKICESCTCNLKKRRGLSSTQRLLASLALSFGVFALWAWLTRSQTRLPGTFRSVLIGAAGWGIVQTAVLWMGLARPPGQRASARVRLVLAVVLPIFFLAYVAHAAPEWVSFGDFSHGPRAAHAVGCGFVGVLFSSVISGGVLLLWRGTDPLRPGLSGALVGLVGGVAGGLTIGVACPSQEGWHACFSHGLGVLAFTAFGWAAGRRLLRP
jgi:hypothetical protein